MLILSRRVGEILYIGLDVAVVISDVGRGQVRIGIEAPKSVNVVRHELLPRDDKRRLIVAYADDPSIQHPGLVHGRHLRGDLRRREPRS